MQCPLLADINPPVRHVTDDGYCRYGRGDSAAGELPDSWLAPWGFPPISTSPHEARHKLRGVGSRVQSSFFVFVGAVACFSREAQLYPHSFPHLRQLDMLLWGSYRPLLALSAETFDLLEWACSVATQSVCLQGFKRSNQPGTLLPPRANTKTGRYVFGHSLLYNSIPRTGN